MSRQEDRARMGSWRARARKEAKLMQEELNLPTAPWQIQQLYRDLVALSTTGPMTPGIADWFEIRDGRTPKYSGGDASGSGRAGETEGTTFEKTGGLLIVTRPA